MKKLLSTLIFLVIISILHLGAQSRVYTPNLISPEDGETEQVPNIVLNWEAVSGMHGIVKYDLQVDTDPAFSNPQTYNTELSGYQIEYLLFATTYYWRVRAVDGPDISDWSEVWSFTTIQTIVLDKPNDLKRDIAPDIILKWDEITGLDKYQIQLDTTYYWGINHDISTESALLDIEIIDENNVWIVGEYGVIYHWDGTDWMLVQDTLTTKNIHAVSFADENTGMAVGEDGLILLHDGTEWSFSPDTLTELDLNSVHMLDPANAWIAGSDTALFQWDGTDWLYWNDSIDGGLNKICFADANNGWAVGPGGLIQYFDGTEWTDQSGITSEELHDVVFLTPTSGYACGNSGTILNYNATEWVEMESNTDDDLFVIAFPDAMNGFALGEEENSVEFDGVHWNPISIGQEANFYALAFLNTSFGFAAGYHPDDEKGLVMNFTGTSFTSPNNIINVPGAHNADTMQYLFFNKVYAWRVRGIHATDTTKWSDTWTFMTQASPELEDPDDEETDVHLLERFKWKKISGVHGYTVEFDDDPNFTLPLIINLESNSGDFEFSEFGTEYFWRVRANHLKDESEWSDPFSFTLINKVSLTSPANGAEDVDLRPTLVWENIEGVDMYQLVYDTLPDMASPCCDQYIIAPDNDFKISLPLIEGKEYFWKVRAVKDVDSSQWSELYSFRIVGPQSIEEQLAENMSVFPNPSKGLVFVNYASNDNIRLEMSVLNLLGHEVSSAELAFGEGHTQHRINLKGLPNGIYILKFKTGKATFMKKITLFK